MADTHGSEENMPKFTTLYFGFASNLAPKTMRQRCPDALYVGIARLDDWKFIINNTGYANIIESPGDHVYGSLYFLTNRGESFLDVIEEVPWHYQKYKLGVTRVGAGDAEEQKVEAMTHVDGVRKEPGKIEEDYIVWLNQAIVGGLKCGVPEEYVEKYLRPFVPKDTDLKEIEMVQTGVQVQMTPNVQYKPQPVSTQMGKDQGSGKE